MFFDAGARALTGDLTGNIWPFYVRDLNCVGNESSFLDCPMIDMNDYSCSNNHQAGVVCLCKYNNMYIVITLQVFNSTRCSQL